MGEISVQDAFILSSLNDGGYNNKCKGCTIEGIQNFFKVACQNKEVKIRRNINRLLERGYLGYGLKRGRYKTYYVTNEGLLFLLEINL